MRAASHGSQVCSKHVRIDLLPNVFRPNTSGTCCEDIWCVWRRVRARPEHVLYERVPDVFWPNVFRGGVRTTSKPRSRTKKELNLNCDFDFSFELHTSTNFKTKLGLLIASIWLNMKLQIRTMLQKEFHQISSAWSLLANNSKTDAHFLITIWPSSGKASVIDTLR